MVGTNTKKLLLCVVLAVFSAVFVLASNSSAADKSDWPRGVAIGTSSIGGTYYVWGGGWAKLLRDKLGIQAAVEAGGGPTANVQKVHKKLTAFGMATMGPAYEGHKGIGWTEGESFNDIRGMFPMYESFLHTWCMPECNIESIYDFNGKNVSFAMSGATPFLYYHRLKEFADLEPNKIITGQYPDISNQMRDGMVCNGATASSFPHPTCLEMVTTENCNVIGIPKEIADPFAKKYGLTTGIIPKGVYDGKEPKQDEYTVTIWNAMLCHKDQLEDFVYEVVKTTMENTDILKKTHPSAKFVTPENAAKITVVPLHVGAIKYYEEQGVQLPPEAYPPEYKK